MLHFLVYADWPTSNSSDNGEPQLRRGRNSNSWDVVASSLSIFPSIAPPPPRELARRLLQLTHAVSALTSFVIVRGEQLTKSDTSTFPESHCTGFSIRGTVHFLWGDGGGGAGGIWGGAACQTIWLQSVGRGGQPKDMVCKGGVTQIFPWEHGPKPPYFLLIILPTATLPHQLFRYKIQPGKCQLFLGLCSLLLNDWTTDHSVQTNT